MSLELYVFPPSPRSFKVMVVANYLGLETTTRPSLLAYLKWCGAKPTAESGGAPSLPSLI